MRFPTAICLSLAAMVFAACAAVGAWATTITIDAVHPGLPIQREMYGHNVSWYTLDKQYQGDYAMAASLLTDYRDMGVGSMRYPGGCMADTFAWEKSIGPFSSRAVQYMNGKPATAKFASSFGLDEYLRFCEQLGAEPQITLEFRAPDVDTRVEAESSYTLVANISRQIAVVDCALDSEKSLSMPGISDAVRLTFSIARDGHYRLALRNRAGNASNSAYYWAAHAYSYKLDNSSITLNNDIASISEVDSIDGQTTWGTSKSNVVYLGYGSHTLTITAQSTLLRVDYLDVEELNHDNSVKRATACVAYCNGDPNDSRSIGVDEAGVDWRTVGYWANLRAQNGHAEPYAVKYWEVGNEAWGPDPYGSPPGRDPVPYDAGWLDYYDSTGAIDKNLRLSLCGYSPSTWTNTLIQTNADKAGYIHFHPYYPNDKSGTDPYTLYLEGVSSYKAVQNYIDSYRNAINTYQPGRLGKIRGSASEWSACYGWSDWDHCTWSANMSGALTVADQLGTMTKNTDLMESTQFWASYGANSYTIFTEYNYTDYFKTGIYESFKLFGNYFGDRCLPVTVSADCPTYYFQGFGSSLAPGYYPMLTAYASQDSAHYYLIVINKDAVNARTATLSWQGLPPCTNRVHVRTISSTNALPNYFSANTTFVTPIRTLTTDLTPFETVSSYSFPACSVTGFVVDKAMPANMVWHREAEDIFTINTDASPYGNIVVAGPWSYDSGGHVTLGNTNDSIIIPFNIRAKGTYTIRVRNRSGWPNAPRRLWDADAYGYYVDGNPVSFTGDENTLSPLDASSVYWGTMALTEQRFNAGRHYLKIKANSYPQPLVDWIEVEQQQVCGNEAETGYTIVQNQSGQAGPGNLQLDGGTHVVMGQGDVVDFGLDVDRSTFYEPQVRVRCGDSSGTSSLVGAYSWAIDGVGVSGSLDAATISPLDADGATYWGTVKLSNVYLRAGHHTIRASYGGSVVGKVDYLSVTAGAFGVAVVGPTSDLSYATDKATIQFSAVAGDGALQITWRNSRGGSGSSAGASLNVQVPLSLGGNALTVTATDSGGAVATDTLVVYRIAGGKSIVDIKKLANSSHAELGAKRVTAVYRDFFYIEEVDRSTGIKVKPSIMPESIAAGLDVCIYGTIGVDSLGERYLYGVAGLVR